MISAYRMQIHPHLSHCTKLNQKEDTNISVPDITYLLSYYRKQKEKKGGGEADCEKGIGASCLLNCFLMSRGVVNFGV